MKRRSVIFCSIALPALGLIAMSGARYFQSRVSQPKLSAPVTTVRRGTVKFIVTARGELQGGNTQSLAVPMTGGGALAITSLLDNGDEVQAGDVVVTFDTTEQEFNLREAEADLAEATQQLVQTQAENQAREEETLAQLLQARTDVEVNQLECRRNELYARITARQNELALAAARDKLRQLEGDLANRKATAAAGIALQEAAQAKAKVRAATAQRNIDAMTLKAKSPGYVALQQNTDGPIRWGMQVPIYQVGDVVRPGVAVAQIPDLHSWEATARIGELDRGHLAEGQPTEFTVVALPGRQFRGKVKVIGGTTGPPWDRHFDCRVTLDDPSTELRPGMSVVLKVNTGQLDGVLWLPAQALFESGGHTFVYERTATGFAARDVTLVRRSEDKAVITGLREGQQVAMASPSDTGQGQKKGGGNGAMQALPKT